MKVIDLSLIYLKQEAVAYLHHYNVNNYWEVCLKMDIFRQKNGNAGSSQSAAV